MIYLESPFLSIVHIHYIVFNQGQFFFKGAEIFSSGAEGCKKILIFTKDSAPGA